MGSFNGLSEFRKPDETIISTGSIQGVPDLVSDPYGSCKEGQNKLTKLSPIKYQIHI